MVQENQFDQLNFLTKTDPVMAFCDKAMAGCFYVLAFFLTLSSAVVETVSALLIILFVVKRVRFFLVRPKSSSSSVLLQLLSSMAPQGGATTLPLMVWCALSILSIFFSLYFHSGWMGFFGKTLQGVFIYFLIIESMNSSVRIRNLVLCFLVSAILVCASGIYQHYWGIDFLRGKYKAHGRITSSLREPTDFGAYLVFLISIIVSLLWVKVADLNTFIRQKVGRLGRGGVLKIALGLLLFTAIECLGFTYSRGAWIAAFMIILFVGFLYNKKYTILFFIIGALLIGFFGSKMMVERKHLDNKSYFALFGRVEQWQAVTSVIIQKPIVGVGLNAYSEFTRDYNVKPGGYPHNCYLQMAAEIGIPGLLAFLWFLGSVLWIGVSSYNKIREPILKSVQLGVLAALGGFLFQIFFDTFFYSTQLSVLMWILLGLVINLSRFEEPYQRV